MKRAGIGRLFFLINFFRLVFYRRGERPNDDLLNPRGSWSHSWRE